MNLRFIKTRALVSANDKAKFAKFLKDIVDVFTWSHDKMQVIDPR